MSSGLTNASKTNVVAPANPTTAPVGRPRVKFAAADLKAIMGVVVDINPYMAKHGMKGQMWKDVADEVKKRGFCSTHLETTIKKKVDMLLAFHEVCFYFLCLSIN
jgi:hypothetical protein